MNRRTAIRAILIFLPLAPIVLGITYLLYASQANAIRSIERSTEDQTLEIAQQRVTLTVDSIASDANYLAEQDALQAFLERSDEHSLHHIEAEYLAFIAHRPYFDQIRFIDLAGREVVRVNREDGKPHLAPPEALQDKPDQPYVSRTLELSAGQTYISQIDLGTEAGAIEQPVNPTIRVATPVFDRAGDKRGLIAINYRAQRVLDRIRDLSNNVADIWLVDADGYWLLGRRPDEAFAVTYAERKDRSFASEYPEIWARMRASTTHGRSSADDGEIAYLRADSSPDAVAQGAAPYWFVVIHASKEYSAGQTEKLRWQFGLAAAVLVLLAAALSLGLARYQVHRRESERRVRASEARFRDLLESAPDAILIADQQGRIQLINAQTETLFGYRREELIGQTIEMLVPERYRGGHAGHRDTYGKAAHTRPMGAGLDLYALRKDGTEFPVSIGLSPTNADHGLTVFCGVRDITGQREAERTIRKLNAQLQQDNAELAAVNQELEAFSYSVSHDLRAPLRAIDGFSQALVEDAWPLLSDAHRSNLTRVRNAAQRMGMLIDDLIKLARVTRAELKIEHVDLSAMARQIAEALQDTALERQAEFVIAPNLHTRGDSRLLHVALENLLNNSWKFTGPRSPARIEFGKIEIDGETAYYVRDNGVGFDMSYASKMFGAFQRFHDARDFAGTGIGLATVQRIIHKHGGRIWAESTPGNGAAFYFTL